MSLTMTKTTEGRYGCEREVYHPCSKLAEPFAVSFYESSDEEDEVGKVGSVPVLAVEIKSSPKASPKANSETTTRDVIALRGEDATETKVRLTSRKRAAFNAAGDTSVEGIVLKNEEVVEVEIPTGDRDIMILDEVVISPSSKPIIVEAPSRITHSPAAQPSAPPRPKRSPFDVLTPENTFGASSPFKVRSINDAGKSPNETSLNDKENYEVPGGFNEGVAVSDVSLSIKDDMLSESSQATNIIFSDTQGFFASLFLFAATLALDAVAYSMVQCELEDEWSCIIVCE